MEYRVEKDGLGEIRVPKDAIWGAQTQRALGNFSVSPFKVPLSLIKAYVLVKKAAAQANFEIGALEERKFKAISEACDRLLAGLLSHDNFTLDAFQGGAGTSTNMNVNEAIANTALELLGREKGSYDIINPLDDVNKHQSTNDTYPTALKVAGIFEIRRLSQNIAQLQGAVQEKEREFGDVLTIGRTELQPAVPMTMGAVFSGFAEAFSRDRWRTFKCEERLRVVNIGGTAVGTGLGAPREYIFLVIEKLREVTGLPLTRAENLVGDTAHIDPFVEVSGILNSFAADIVKVANDIRLYAMDGQLVLPKLQMGSSIMAGKYNPVVLESAIQAGLYAMSMCGLVADISSRGTFQINEYMPLLSFAFLNAIDILANTADMLARHIKDISCDRQRCTALFRTSKAIATALVPHIGYDKVHGLLREFEEGKHNDLFAFFEERMGRDLVDKVFSAENLLKLGY